MSKKLSSSRQSSLFKTDFELLKCLQANRHAAFDALTGQASRTYDEGRVQIGDELLHLGTMKEFFLYFKAMH